MFIEYCQFKSKGNMGQQEKAFRMLQSRKIVNVKVFKDPNCTEIFVKGLIKKSYGTEIRPAVLMFPDGVVPKKGYCLCPVGTSGICCHILALLLFLKHYTDTKEKLLELTVTQPLQKWHKRSQKGSIPMLPLKNLKLRSAKIKNKNKNNNITAADSTNSYFKRDVSSIISTLEDKLKKEKPVEKHVYETLMRSELGRNSSVGQHLEYKYTLETAETLSDHDFTKNKLFDSNLINIDNKKLKAIQYHIDNPSKKIVLKKAILKLL